MKTKVTIVALVVTAIAVYFIRRRTRKEEEYVPVKKSHHLTDAFSKAKKVQIAGE